MCNINVFLTTLGDLSPLRDVINTTTALSFARNSDGEGYFSLGKNPNLVKNREKVIFNETNLRGNTFLAVHERLSTSGFNDLMIHPHIKERFVLLHNGVFHGIGNKEKSDTAVYLEKINEEFIKTGDLIKALNKVHEDISGYFSVVLWDKVEQKVYYFKNGTAQMYFFRNENFLFMSTVKENISLVLRELGIKGKIKPVKNLRLFEVLEGLKSVGKIKDTGYGAYTYKPYVQSYIKKEEQELLKGYSWLKKEEDDYAHNWEKYERELMRDCIG